LVEKGTAIESSVMSKPTGLFGMGGSPFMGSTHGRLAFKDIAGRSTPGLKLIQAAQYAHNLNRLADFVGRTGQIVAGGAATTIVGKKIFGSNDRD